MRSLTASHRCHEAGTTLIELVVGLVITSILVTGIYQVFRNVTASASRERQKAELQRDIISVSNIIERDVRMAGCALPGNGLIAHCSDTASDRFSLYLSESGLRTSLFAQAEPSHTTLLIDDATGFTENGGVCLAAFGIDTIYKEINHLGIDAAGPDTLILNESLNTAQPFGVASTRVYPADRIDYRFSVTAGVKKFERRKNGQNLNIGPKLDSLNIMLKNSAGNPVGGSIKNASVITVVIGGYVGSGAKRVFIADSTEVNFRNSD